MAATLKDLAALVGVSVNTASRALKDKPDIGLLTRQRVKEAAAALGYRPNLNARSLVLKKSSIIGVAVTESDNPVRMGFCEKLRALAANDGYRLLTAGLSVNKDENDAATIEDLLARGVDGLVIGYLSGILAEQPIGRILQECRKNHLPVTIFGAAETGLADNVCIDFYESAYRLTSYLLERGRIPTAFFGEHMEPPRRQGYVQAMTDHGFQAKITTWPIEGHRLNSGKEAVEKYLQQFQHPPDAIIAPNDIAAIGIIATLKERGWKVPEEVAVVGFDNIEIGAYYDPPLTSIGFDDGYFAEQVWNLISTRLKFPETEDVRLLRLHQNLVIRGSC